MMEVGVFPFITLLLLLYYFARGRNRSPHRSRQMKLARTLPRELHGTVTQEGPSYLERVRTAIEESPAGPIDYRHFEPIPAARAGMYYLPGAREAMSQPEEAPQEQIDSICAAVLAVKRRWIRDWRTLEMSVREIEAHSTAYALLKELPLEDITYPVALVFARMACHSTDLNAVKWGILVAGMRLNPEQQQWMMDLARYSEFTWYVCTAIRQGERNYPTTSGTLLELIPTAEGWGYFAVMLAILNDYDLTRDPETCRDLITHSITNAREAGVDVTAVLLEHVDLPARLQAAAVQPVDPVLTASLFALLPIMIHEPEDEPLLRKQEHAEQLIGGYLRLARVAPAGIEMLAALHALIGLLNDETLPWPRRIELLEGTWNVYLVVMNHDAIADAIRRDWYRFAAMEIARDMGIRSLAPVIVEDFRRHPHPAAANAIGVLGSREQVQDLLRLAAAMENRDGSSGSITALLEGDELNTALRSVALHHIGKLNTRKAHAVLKRGARDHIAQVRYAALSALRYIPRWTLDAEWKAIIRTALHDDVEEVRNTAVEMAELHALGAGIGRPARTVTMEELGMMGN